MGGDVFPAGFSDKALGRRLRAALPIADPTDRIRACAELDADSRLQRQPPPFATPVTTDFISDRIGCQIHQPIYAISLGALCVRR